MIDIEFKAWPKIGRENPFKVTITEKINGTNACIIIKDNQIAAVQSRKRFITPANDNYGFAEWVENNKVDLLSLGDGYHYGEWAGLSIQKNPRNLKDKEFFLFNTFRWNPDNPNRPNCCSVVPVLYDGELEKDTVNELLDELKKDGEFNNETPEGLVVYYHAFRLYTKHTIISPDGKWRE